MAILLTFETANPPSRAVCGIYFTSAVLLHLHLIPIQTPAITTPFEDNFLTMGVWVFFGLELFYMLKHCLPHDKVQKWIFKIPFGALVYLYGAPCVLRETQDTAKY